jgi:hypothetical protein
MQQVRFDIHKHKIPAFLFCFSFFFKIAFYSLFLLIFLFCFVVCFFLGRDKSGFGIWPFPDIFVFFRKKTIRILVVYSWVTVRLATTKTTRAHIYFTTLYDVVAPVISQVANGRDKSIIVYMLLQHRKSRFGGWLLQSRWRLVWRMNLANQGQWTCPPIWLWCMNAIWWRSKLLHREDFFFSFFQGLFERMWQRGASGYGHISKRSMKCRL